MRVSCLTLAGNIYGRTEGAVVVHEAQSRLTGALVMKKRRARLDDLRRDANDTMKDHRRTEAWDPDTVRWRKRRVSLLFSVARNEGTSMAWIVCRGVHVRGNVDSICYSMTGGQEVSIRMARSLPGGRGVMNLDARSEPHGYTPWLATRRDGEMGTQRVILRRFLVH